MLPMEDQTVSLVINGYAVQDLPQGNVGPLSIKRLGREGVNGSAYPTLDQSRPNRVSKNLYAN